MESEMDGMSCDSIDSTYTLTPSIHLCTNELNRRSGRRLTTFTLMERYKQIITWMTSVIIMLMITGNTYAQTVVPPILIGAILPLSGSFSGSGYRAWVLLNQSMADIQGNLPADVFQGQQMQLRIADSGSTVSGSIRAALTLESAGCAAILTGFEGMQNQNLTLLASQAVSKIREQRAAGALASTSAAAAAAGVSAAGTALVDAITSIMNARPTKLPVLVPTSVGCQSTRGQPGNFIPLCTPSGTLAEALAATFTSLGWTAFSLVAQDSIEGSWNSRYAQQNFFSTSGLGDQGGGQSQMNHDAILAEAILTEVYLKTGSKVQDPSWPYSKLKTVNRYQLPSIPISIPDAISTTLQAIQDSRLFVVVLLLSGSTLDQFLQQAYLAGMLGQNSPYTFVGVGDTSRRGGNIGVVEGDGSFASRGAGPGLCSAATAAKIQQFQNEVLSERLAQGDLQSTGTINVASTTVAPTNNVDNPVAQFASSNPLVGSICFTPAVPVQSAKWTTLRYRMLEQGLPTSTILDAQDGAVYDSVTLFATAWSKAQAALVAAGFPNTTLPTGPQVTEAFQSLSSVAGLGSTWSFDPSLSGNGRIGGLVDIINFEQLDSGSPYHFPIRATWNSGTGRMNWTDSPIIFASGSPTIPKDFINQWSEEERLPWTYEPNAIWIQLLMVLLAVTNSAMYLSKARHADPDAPEQKARHYWALSKAAVGYASLVLLGNVVLGLIFLTIPSSNDTKIHTGFFFMVWIIGYLLVFGAFIIAGSQNGSTVKVWKHPRIARYEIAGKSGIAGGGGGSGVNFLSSESSGDGGGDYESLHGSHVSPIALSPTGRTAPYGSHRSRSIGPVSKGHRNKTPVPLWSRAMEEIYITLVLMLTSWRMILSGLLLMIANEIIFEVLLLTRVLPLWIVETVDSGLATGEIFWSFFLHAFGITILFRETRMNKQFFGVLWLTGTNVGEFYMQMASVHYTYVTNRGRSPDSNGAYWSPSDIALVLFILVAGALLSNLALTIDILQLSRGTLDQVLLSAKRNLSDLEAKLVSEKDRTKLAKGVTEYMRRTLELINLVRPLHRNHALAFALADVNDSASMAGGGKKKHALIPPCFDQLPQGERAATTAAGKSDGKDGRTDSKGAAPTTGGGTGGKDKSVIHRDVSVSRSHAAPGTPPLSAAIPKVQAPPMVLPGSRAPSGGIDSHPTTGSTGLAHTALTGGGHSVGVASGAPTSYEHLDFSFLAAPKNEAVALKLLSELSESLFLASGPVHHRAVADIQLSHILAHPVAIELFKDHLQRPGSQAQMACWMDIQRWKTLEGGQDARQIVAEEMVKTFLPITSPGVKDTLTVAGHSNSSSSSSSSTHITHPLTGILPSTRDSLHRAIAHAGSITLPKSLFDTLEAELIYQLQKELSGFQGTTAFKIVALILGHAAYQPDTRVGAVVRGRAANPPTLITGGTGGVTVNVTIGATQAHGNSKGHSLGGGIGGGTGLGVTGMNEVSGTHAETSDVHASTHNKPAASAVHFHLYASGDDGEHSPQGPRSRNLDHSPLGPRPSKPLDGSPKQIARGLTINSPSDAHHHQSTSVELIPLPSVHESDTVHEIASPSPAVASLSLESPDASSPVSSPLESSGSSPSPLEQTSPSS